MRPRPIHIGSLACALALAACGNLDNVTTVKDLRVLAVKTDPAGFLVPLDDPSSLKDTLSKVTALVVDPQHPQDILMFGAAGCPDFIDTITAASGKTSKLCPDRATTDRFPAPLDMALRTTQLPSGLATPVLNSTIQYEPQVVFGLSQEQLGLFFSPTGTGVPALDQSIQYNRDFGVDAIMNLSFAMEAETAGAIKRIQYWPLLPASVLPPPDTSCPTTQTPNENPDLGGIDFFHHRVDGIPTDAVDRGEVPTISLSVMDHLYVQPIFDDSLAEKYFLRVKNAETGLVETQCRKELLTFQFFASAGTFEPPERTSELSPVLTVPDNGHIPIDSQWKPPAASDLPAGGNVTVWIVTRDERGGASWSSRQLIVAP